MAKRKLLILVIVGGTWLAMSPSPPALGQPLLPFAYRLRPKVLFRYGVPYRDPYPEGGMLGYYANLGSEMPESVAYQPNPPSAGSAKPANNRAHLQLRVPTPNAQVWFDNSPTSQQGLQRGFDSPPLEPGYRYRYEIRARWRQDGRDLEQTMTVHVQPGQDVTVDFTEGRTAGR